MFVVFVNIALATKKCLLTRPTATGGVIPVTNQVSWSRKQDCSISSNILSSENIANLKSSLSCSCTSPVGTSSSNDGDSLGHTVGCKTMLTSGKEVLSEKLLLFKDGVDKLDLGSDLSEKEQAQIRKMLWEEKE